jgi:prevent-host-death family protein
MIRVSSTEFGKEVGRYQDAARSQPVIVTRNGRDRTVVISAEEYRRLQRRDREVLGIVDFTNAEIDAVRWSEPSSEAEAFNGEIEALAKEMDCFAALAMTDVKGQRFWRKA